MLNVLFCKMSITDSYFPQLGGTGYAVLAQSLIVTPLLELPSVRIIGQSQCQDSRPGTGLVLRLQTLQSNLPVGMASVKPPR